MAFNKDGLKLVAVGGSVAQTHPSAGNTNRVWNYVTTDDTDTIAADGYFDSTDLLKGDIVLAVCLMSSTPKMRSLLCTVGTGNKDSNDVTVALQSST